jgi:hypothetical protein
MRISSRKQIWPACVAPAKNNFICEFIVKRDKRMRDAGRCAGRYPGVGNRTRERAYNFSAHFSVRRGARTVLTIVNSVTHLAEN